MRDLTSSWFDDDPPEEPPPADGPVQGLWLTASAWLPPELLSSAESPDGDADAAVPAGFGQGGVLDELPPGPVLATFTAETVGGIAGTGLAATCPDHTEEHPPAKLARLGDDELTGIIRSFRKQTSSAQAGELAAVAELASRRRAQAAAGGTRDAIAADAANDEIAAALTLTGRAAQVLTDRATTLQELPGTFIALATGRIDMPKALVLLTGLAGQEPSLARAVEAQVIDRAATQTTGQLRAALNRALLAADPAAAERRRQEEEKYARIEQTPEPGGVTASLTGRYLPVTATVAAWNRITALARQLRTAGASGNLDELRVRVYLALLTGQAEPALGDTPPGAGDVNEDTAAPRGDEDIDQGGAASSDTGRDGDAGPPVKPGRNRDEEPTVNPGGHSDAKPQCGPDGDSDAKPAGDPDGQRDARPAGKPDGQRHARPAVGPGTEMGAGPPVDPGRDSDVAGADDRDGDVEASSSAGSPSAHDSSPAEKQPGSSGTGGTQPRSPRAAETRTDARPPAGAGRLTGTVNLTVPLATLLGVADTPGELGGFGPVTAYTAREVASAALDSSLVRWCVTVTDDSGEPVGHGCARTGRRRRGASADPNGWAFTVTLRALAAADCRHERESSNYRPPPWLWHLIQIRHQRCTFAGCRMPAARCDDDHTIPFDKGGRTCECNLGPLCRHHHRVKQLEGWRLEQVEPGVFAWVTPSGWKYITGREMYAA